MHCPPTPPRPPRPPLSNEHILETSKLYLSSLQKSAVIAESSSSIIQLIDGIRSIKYYCEEIEKLIQKGH